MRLIEDIDKAWRFASVRLALFAGIVAAWAASQPEDFLALVEQLPPWARPLVGLAVFAAAAGSRVIKRGKPSETQP